MDIHENSWISMTVFSVIKFERRNVRACCAHERVARKRGNDPDTIV